jgi:hypothetical protein
VNRACCLLCLGVLALTAPWSTVAEEASIAELLAAGRLHINSTLDPDSSIVPGQRVRLILEIATDTWFTGGTRIGIPEIPGLVILQTEQFASNASETRNGTTWVIQRWTLDVFPQRAGEFTIVPIPLKVKVNADGSDTSGELLSPALHFSVNVPDVLATAEHWVAAPEFSVSQQFDKPLDDLGPGDAFEQHITFEASDVLAMMLPTYEAEQQAGLAAYPSPPVLDNRSNRGQSVASRSVRISYVVEEPGQYLLGARDYFWWNTQRGELELLTVPETRIEVTGVAPGSTLAREFDTRRMLLLAVLLRMAFVFLPRLPWHRFAALHSHVTRQWQALRAPALATRLNPDALNHESTAAAQKAAPPR